MPNTPPAHRELNSIVITAEVAQCNIWLMLNSHNECLQSGSAQQLAAIQPPLLLHCLLWYRNAHSVAGIL